MWDSSKLCASLHQPLECPATIAHHASILSSSAPFTLVSTHHPLPSRSSTSDPAADDTQIALPLPADATRACCLDSRDSNVTQEAHPTYIAAWVCCHPPFLHLSDLRLTVIRPMSHRFVLVLCDLYVPCPLIIPHLHRSYHVLLMSQVLPLTHSPTPPNAHSTTSKCALTMSELFAASASATLCKVFCIGTATIIIPATCIRWQCSSSDDSISGGVEAAEAKMVQDTMLPVGGEDSTPHALWEWLVVIQEGHIEWKGWGIPRAVTDTVSPTMPMPTPCPDVTNATSQQRRHCTPMTPPSHPNNTDIASR